MHVLPNIEIIAGLFGAVLSLGVQKVRPLRAWKVESKERALDVFALVLSVGISSCVRALTETSVELSLRPLRTTVAIVAFDCLLYAVHRLNHRWSWQMHRLHHLPTHFDTGMAFRGSAIYLLCFALGFAGVTHLFGLTLGETMGVGAVFFGMQWWIHANVWLPLGPLDWVLVSPRHHALHHTPARRGFHHNFGGLLCVWDQLFGTYRHPPRERPTLSFGMGGVRADVFDWLGAGRPHVTRARTL